MQINEEKMKLSETMRQVESNKREIFQSIENEKLRINHQLSENKEATLLLTNDKTDKAKEDILNRIRDLERVNFIYIYIFFSVDIELRLCISLLIQLRSTSCNSLTSKIKSNEESCNKE